MPTLEHQCSDSGENTAIDCHDLQDPNYYVIYGFEMPVLIMMDQCKCSESEQFIFLFIYVCICIVFLLLL